eukprot:TRINITY_DN66599_c0_g1_i1.p1 TRINITY_DN66599_c0_g1~~TRINITY_DN66599_c0_g1_i1.p1  ORF type:complete len:490 (+),score=91.58 TRINITY_DN66599_c0_g1_i1:81-1550(+)
MEDSVFMRLEALQQRRRELQDVVATPAELENISRAELEELRHLLRPPQVVRECLDVVFAALHVDKASKLMRSKPPGERLSFPWPEVQRMLIRYDSFFPAMMSYDLTMLLSAPELAQHISFAYFDPQSKDRLTEERVRKCSVAAAALYRWCGCTVTRVIAALELQTVVAEIEQLQAQTPHPQDVPRQATPPPEMQHEDVAEQQPPPLLDAGLGPWEVETDCGWEPWTPGVPFEVAPGAEVTYSRDWFKYKATFLTPLRGIQVNLSTKRRRPLRRCQQAAVTVPQILPLEAAEIEPVNFTWDSKLSNPDLNLTGLWSTPQSLTETASSPDISFGHKAVFGANVMQRGKYHIPITYNGGEFVYLVAGLVQSSGRDNVWSTDGHFKDNWENGKHAGCWSYSFFYNMLSADGAEWSDESVCFQPKFMPGDQLVLELNLSSGMLAFFYKKEGQSKMFFIGGLGGLRGQFRVMTLLGSGKQSVSFARSCSLVMQPV